MENQPPGTGVLRVQAQDADLGVNGQVKYGIMHRDGVSSGFHIDPDTGNQTHTHTGETTLSPCLRDGNCCHGDVLPPGHITTTASFDRERQREFTLWVTATDQADQPLIGICQVTIVVADQNDNDPKFENSRYQCEYCPCCCPPPVCCPTG